MEATKGQRLKAIQISHGSSDGLGLSNEDVAKQVALNVSEATVQGEADNRGGALACTEVGRMSLAHEATISGIKDVGLTEKR